MVPTPNTDTSHIYATLATAKRELYKWVQHCDSHLLEVTLALVTRHNESLMHMSNSHQGEKTLKDTEVVALRL